MNRAEKREQNRQRRESKKQRKAYLREERQSLKRKRREQKRINHLRKHGNKISFWSLILNLFSKKTSSPKQKKRHRRISWRDRYRYYREDRRNRIRQKMELTKSRKESRMLRSKYLEEERQSTGKMEQAQQDKNNPMRQQMKRDRLRYLKERLTDFFKEPIKIRKRKHDDKVLRRNIRADIRQQRKKMLYNLPARMALSLKRFRTRRVYRFRHSMEIFSDFIFGFRTTLSTKEQRNNGLISFANSLVLFLLAFLSIYYFNQLVTIFTAKFYNIPAILYSYRIFWPLYTYSTLYTRQALILIFGTGPLLTLIVAFLVFRLFLIFRKTYLNLNMLLLWMAIHAMNMFFGAYIAGVITRTGFVYTTEWLFFSNVFDVEEIIFILISFFVLIITGVFATKHFISAAVSGKIIDPKIRLYYIIGQIILPVIIGYLILYFMNFPKNPPELLILYATTLLMILPSLTNYNSPSNRLIRRPNERKKVKMGWIYIVALILLFIAIRRVVFYGISFS